MDQDKSKAQDNAGRREPARHISMKLQADGARVTNLSMDGNRLILTIEADLFSSQVKTTVSAEAAPPDTEDLVRPDASPDENAGTPSQTETVPNFAGPAASGDRNAAASASMSAVGENRLEKAFAVGVREGVADLSRPGESGGAGIVSTPAPSSSSTALYASPPVAGAGTKTGEISYEDLENEIKKIKTRETSIGGDRPYAERASSVSGDESEKETADIVPGYGGVFAAPSFARGKADADAPVELKGDMDTATQHISYGGLAGSQSSEPPVVAGEDEIMPPPPSFGDEPAEHLVYQGEDTGEAEDVLESLPLEADKEIADGDEPAAHETVLKIDPADLNDGALALSEESSAVGGDRHGEPLPSMSFGCEALTAAPVSEAAPSSESIRPPETPGFETPMPEEKAEANVSREAPDVELAKSGAEAPPKPAAEAAADAGPKPAAPVDMAADSASGVGSVQEAEREPPLPPQAPLEASEPPAVPRTEPEPTPRAEVPAMNIREPSPERQDDAPRTAGGGTTVLIRYTCPKCKTQGMQAVDKVGTVVNCSNCGKAMRLVMKK